jgi:hypothetical protein
MRCFAAAILSVAVAVSCDDSPNCTLVDREDCDVNGLEPNMCGACKDSYVGAAGPSNAVCITDKGCGIVFPASADRLEECPPVLGHRRGPAPGFRVPFGACVCDDDGLIWPTAENKCAKIAVTGDGVWQLLMCHDTSCQVCDSFAEWAAPDECVVSGSDQFLLKHYCEPPEIVCPHPGQRVTEEGECVIAPTCPQYIVEPNLGQSCCEITRLAKTPNVIPEVDGSLSYKGGGNGTRGFCMGGPLGEPCSATSRAKGWTGCICEYGDVGNDKCTVECDEFLGCPYPDDGIDPPVDPLHEPLSPHLLDPNYISRNADISEAALVSLMLVALTITRE